MKMKLLSNMHKGTTVLGQCFWGTLLAVVFFQAATAFAVVLVPTDLSPGDTYHLAFVTAGTLHALSSDIADYDAFVKGAAFNAGWTNIPEDHSPTPGVIWPWYVLGSTGVPAHDHTPVFGPVYRLDGQRIANNQADLWDGFLAVPINIDEYGNSHNEFPDNVVWTGTFADGYTSNFGILYGGLGALVWSGLDALFYGAGFGFSTSVDPAWMFVGWEFPFGGTPFHHFYAISGPLTVPPVANAGPNQTVIRGQTVQLDGSGSSQLGSPTFQWSIYSKPAGSAAVLSSSLVNPMFVTDKVGLYVLQLVVLYGRNNFPYNADTITVIAQTPQDATQDLITQVQALVDAGVLNQGQGNALEAKLEAAIMSLDKGNDNAKLGAAIMSLDKGNDNEAINQLNAFINQVNAFINGGILSPAEGDVLIAAANNIIDAI
jgi:hypothetical protein